jgi:hypothetical protein
MPTKTPVSPNLVEIRMLPRDWELINFIEEQGFVTFGQLSQKFFHSKDSTCSMRLKKMIESGYISKRKLVDLFKFSDEKRIRPMYFPHLLNLNVSPRQNIYFINRDYAKGFGKSAQLFKTSMIIHQLILGDLRVFLEGNIVHKRLFNDPKAKIIANTLFGRSSDTIPDLTLEYNNVRVAIELERTIKGRSQYLSRFQSFESSRYTHVVYYYTEEPQLKTLLRAAGTRTKLAFSHYRTPNELYSNVFGLLDIHTFLHKTIN